MKKIYLLLSLVLIGLFAACTKNADEFPEYDSYLYVWKVRTWNVGAQGNLSDIKVSYFFQGDTTRVEKINFWIVKKDATLYADEAMKHQDKAYAVTEIVNDPDQKVYKNQCSFRFPEGIYTDYDGDSLRFDQEYRLMVKAIGTDDKIVDSPMIEGGVFVIADPDVVEEEETL